MWAGVSRGGRTARPTQRDEKHDVRYRDDILDVYVRPYAGAIGPRVILMDDKSTPGLIVTCRVVAEYLQQETIVRMDWSACSPDLNPIEHVWNITCYRWRLCDVRSNQRLSWNRELTEPSEWNNIEMAGTKRLIGSMRRRCQAVIASRGSHKS